MQKPRNMLSARLCCSVQMHLVKTLNHTRFFFFIRTINFRLRLGSVFLIFWRFQPQVVLKLLLFPDISKQWISRPIISSSGNTASANVTSLLITLPAPDYPGNSNTASLCIHVHLNLCTNFSLVIVLSMFLIFGHISAWVFL